MSDDAVKEVKQTDYNSNITQSVEQNKHTKTTSNKNKKSASSSAFVINEIKPVKRTPAKMLEMQQAFVENYYNLPPNNNATNTANAANGQNKQKSPAPNNSTNAEANQAGLGTLGQIAPLFNLLGGGKNAQIGSLISALGDGKMDMNKVISAMAPAAGAGNNLFSVFNPNKAKPANSPQKEPTTETGSKSIKDLHKI